MMAVQRGTGRWAVLGISVSRRIITTRQRYCTVVTLRGQMAENTFESVGNCALISYGAQMAFIL
jgi:hypothetical protein